MQSLNKFFRQGLAIVAKNCVANGVDGELDIPWLQEENMTLQWWDQTATPSSVPAVHARITNGGTFRYHVFLDVKNITPDVIWSKMFNLILI